jgi:ABC-type polysaccharide transport system permease subunit
MAISLFRSVVNCIFLIAADRSAKKLGGSGLFG